MEEFEVRVQTRATRRLVHTAAIAALCIGASLAGCYPTATAPEKKSEPQFVREKVELNQLPAPPFDSLRHMRLPKMVVIPAAEQPPAMNGDFTAKCWKDAASLQGFTVLNKVVERGALALQPALRPWEFGPALVMRTDEQGRAFPAEGTTALFCHDKTALYVAFKCTDSQVVATVQQPDGPVWMDDCVEFFLDPHASGASVYHIAVTARGTKFDERFQQEAPPSSRGAAPTGRRWDCKMTFITGRSKDGWWAQMAIPFESLGEKWPDAGSLWMMNLARWNSPPILHGVIEFNEISAWAPAEISPSESAAFGRLYFLRGPAAVVERLMPGQPGEGVNTAQVSLRDLSGKGQRAELILSTQTEDGDLIETTSQKVSLDPGGAQTVGLAYKIPPDVRKCYLAATLMSENGQNVLDSMDMALDLPEKEMALDLGQSDFVRGGRPIRALVSINKGDVSVGLYGLRLQVVHENNVVAGRVIERLESQRVEAVIQDPTLAPGSYMLRAQLLQDKKVVAETAADMEIHKGPLE